MRLLILFLSLVAAVSPEDVTRKLNSLYSSISGRKETLYVLIDALSDEYTESKGTSQMILLLNNTYKGLALHTIITGGNVEIFNHTKPNFTTDPLGANYIQQALISLLNIEELSLNSLYIEKQSINDYELYSSSVNIDLKDYKVSVLVFGNKTTNYITSRPSLTLSSVSVQESSSYTPVLLGIFLGFFTQALLLYLFFRKHKRLPLTTNDPRAFPSASTS